MPSEPRVYQTGLIPPIAVCVALAVLAIAQLFPLVDLSAWDEQAGIGWFAYTGSLNRAFDAPTPKEYWPSGIPPILLAFFAAIPLIGIAVLLFRRRSYSRHSLIALAAALWGIGAALFLAATHETTLIGESVQKQVDAGQFPTLFSPNVEFGPGCLILIVVWLLLGGAGFSVLFLSRPE